MKNPEVKYQLLQDDDHVHEQSNESSIVHVQDDESGRRRSAVTITNSTNLLQRIMYCPPKWTLFLVIATFVTLYVFTTVEVSFADNRRSWTPTSANTFRQPVAKHENISNNFDQIFQQKLLKPFTNLVSQLSSSVAKLSGQQQARPTDKFVLPERIQLNNSQTYQMVEHESNLAATYWERWTQINFGKDTTEKANTLYCHKVQMVSPHKVRQNNIYWQIVDMMPKMEFPKKKKMRTMNKLYLYNAYYDNRLKNKPAVKLIATTDQQVQVETIKWWCLLWFDNLKPPVLSTVSEVYTVWPEYWDFGVKDGTYGPQIVTCDIPKEYSNQVPQAVSIQTTGDCEAMSEEPSNVLRVINNQRTTHSDKPSIGICVQAFRFGTYDVSVRLIEWLEMVKIMGTDQVYFYVYGATQNMMKVLKHYQKEDFVNWRTLTLPGEQVNVPSMYNYYFSQLGGKFWPQELLELNDCLYRNLFRHDYLVVMDIDEMIMPQTMTNWHDLIESIRADLSENDRAHKAFYSNRHAYVYEMFEESQMDGDRVIPEYLYMMRHTYRGELLEDGTNIKCFHRTDRVTAVHNHYPMRCINTTGHHSCDGISIDPKQSILMHYRRNRSPPENCKTPQDSIKCTVHDRTAWRFADKLDQSVKKQLMTIFS